MTIEQAIRDAVRRAFQEQAFFEKEDGLHKALAQQLKPHVWKPSLRFESAKHPVPGPSDDDLRRLASAGKSAVLDPCEKRGAAALDLLWHSPEGPVAIEVKFRNLPEWSGKSHGERILTKSSSDIYGRGFLLDVHRLERLSEVRKGKNSWQPGLRFALFVTNDRMYWTGDGERESSFRLVDNSVITAGHHAAYSQPSVDTRWVTYPPFRLAHSYRLIWTDVGNDVSAFSRSVTDGRPWPVSRMLILPVPPQIG